MKGQQPLIIQLTRFAPKHFISKDCVTDDHWQYNSCSHENDHEWFTGTCGLKNG
ncbi:hypothetical protein theurythT_23190 [Thalassotalea eurytherma]|uniref:Uncharacterized protein n=1 Tax=Thalassotalea eurytherma TaxID=1144278 RepID=A0ABQ6H5H9_9GAMM|nr:hypothetical protein theurythT_23190 [Thalassotalea eurytherma]